MSRYLLVESRDPFDSADVQSAYDMACDLVRNGHQVILFLVQNGVLPARTSGASAALSAVADAGVEVLADAFSLRERGIALEHLAPGVAPSPLEAVIDHLAAGHKTFWH